MRRHMELGVSPGQPRLAAPGEAPSLSSGKEVLPSLESVDETPRPMWRHPAFVVSSILALLALVAAGVLMVTAILGPRAGTVSDASVDTSSGNAHLSWSANGPVELYSITGGQVLDLTQFVAGENEAWLPAALGVYKDSSCFVIRPAAEKPEQREAVALDADVLAAQRAASACVSDAQGAEGTEGAEEGTAEAAGEASE